MITTMKYNNCIFSFLKKKRLPGDWIEMYLSIDMYTMSNGETAENERLKKIDNLQIKLDVRLRYPVRLAFWMNETIISNMKNVSNINKYL